MRMWTCPNSIPIERTCWRARKPLECARFSPSAVLLARWPRRCPLPSATTGSTPLPASTRTKLGSRCRPTMRSSRIWRSIQNFLPGAKSVPIIIHCREAWPDCLALLEKHWGSSGLGGIFHCFSGTLEEARRGMEMGFLISFAGNVTYPKAQNLRDLASALPLESILIETDSPFLAPQPFRGRRNEPAFVAELARTLAPVRNLAPHELAAATAANFRRFFRLSEIRSRRLQMRD